MAKDSTSRKRVLLVDDEELLVRTAADGFRAYADRLELRTAHNGKQALEVLRREPVDLVVTDLRMPEMDGFELLAVLMREFPRTAVVVMTAFGTPEIEDRLKSAGVLSYLDKPLDFAALSSTVLQTLAAGASGRVQGITLPSLMQVINMEQKTCVLQVRSQDRTGVLHFDRGSLVHASTGYATGDRAALDMVGWDEAEVDIASAAPRVPHSITLPLTEVLMEGIRLKDEHARDGVADAVPAAWDEFASLLEDDRTPPPEPTASEIPAIPDNTITQESIMAAKDKLQELAQVEGFQGAAVFTPTGEELSSIPGSITNIKDVGVLANAVLLNAQKATLEMNCGRGQQVHIEGEKAHVFARCVNEGTDPLKSQPGRAHVHVVMVVKPDASMGMAKLRLNSVADRLAEDFRM